MTYEALFRLVHRQAEGNGSLISGGYVAERPVEGAGGREYGLSLICGVLAPLLGAEDADLRHPAPFL